VTDALDLLLEQVREPEPSDESFVKLVMYDVRASDVRPIGTGRRFFRRPFVLGITAAVVVTGGAVAAVVGTNPKPAPPSATAETGTARVTAEGAPLASDAASIPNPPGAKPSAPSTPASGNGWGYSSNHTSYVLDAKSGLRLQTETYKTEFEVGKPQRVTVTLENTSKRPIALSSTDGCAMQVMAFPASSQADSSAPEDYSGRFAWVCAGSDNDPRSAGIDENFVLAPGDRHVADAYVSLPESGAWSIIGMCRCTYSKVEQPSPAPPKGDPLTDITDRATQRTLPAPIVPAKSDGKSLATPPIRVEAR
jgi:hypothetical protein